MSNRRKEFTKTSSNPASKFLEWKSDEKCFSFYNKETRENEKIYLPLKFLVLMEMHTVKGWDDASGSGIWSNEVSNIGEDTIEVKAFKGGLIAKGIYKDVKETIAKRGGHYVKSIYAMLPDFSLVNIGLKGSGVQAWGDFSKKSARRLPEEWVEVTGAEEKVKGKVKYSTPIFKFESVITKSEDEKAEGAFITIKQYIDRYTAEKEVVAEAEDDFLKGTDQNLQSATKELPF